MAQRLGLSGLTRRAAKEWRKCVDRGDAESVFARDQASGEYSPGPESVANSLAACVRVDRVGEIDAFIDNLANELLRQSDRTRLAVASLLCRMAYVDPTFEEDVAFIVDDCNIQAAFKTEIIVERFALFCGQRAEGLGAIPRPLHRLGARQRGRTDAAGNIKAD